tara:strand:+ start:1668 stop:2045 length:378 start_codon:yes stop_codon:yes gene_type:complete
MTSIAEFEGARKNLMRSEGLHANKYELLTRRTGRTLSLFISILYNQSPSKFICFNGPAANIHRDRFVDMLKSLRIPHDNVKSEKMVRVRKFGGRGGTFPVVFTSREILETSMKDPENLKIFFDEE